MIMYFFGIYIDVCVKIKELKEKTYVKNAY